MIAAGWLAPEQAALAVFFPTQSNNRCGYRQGPIYAVLFSIALGILTEISYSVRAQQGT
jgi:hypothetical protein